MKEVKAVETEQYFVGHITYIMSREETHYLSLVTDAFSRRMMGHLLIDDMSAENVAMAMKMAADNRKTSKELVHHSDRGLQYCSSICQNEQKRSNGIPLMTDGYDCYQNALAEGINGILKGEFLINTCNTGKELKILIPKSIETYNNKRPHLSLNYKAPNFIYHKKPSEVSFTGFI
jgi:transposase InsO family protein